MHEILLGTIQILLNQKRWVGQAKCLVMFAYMVGEWVWQDAYVIKKITKKIISEFFINFCILRLV